MPVKREFKKEPEMGEAEFFFKNSYRDTVVLNKSAILVKIQSLWNWIQFLES